MKLVRIGAVVSALVYVSLTIWYVVLLVQKRYSLLEKMADVLSLLFLSLFVSAFFAWVSYELSKKAGRKVGYGSFIIATTFLFASIFQHSMLGGFIYLAGAYWTGFGIIIWNNQKNST